MTGAIVTRIGHCDLPDGPLDELRGHWVAADCEEYTAALGKHDYGELHVWSSLTDRDGEYGSPFVFTCWGTKELPVAATGGAPSTVGPEPSQCQQVHAVFVPVGEAR